MISVEERTTLARRQRVLILYGNPLFAESLSSLLRAEDGLEVATVKASGAEEPGALLGFHPDVVIVEESAVLSQEEGSYLRNKVSGVIRLSLKDNAMRVAYKRQVSPASVEDLLSAIKSRGPASWRSKHEAGLPKRHRSGVKNV